MRPQVAMSNGSMGYAPVATVHVTIGVTVADRRPNVADPWQGGYGRETVARDLSSALPKWLH